MKIAITVDIEKDLGFMDSYYGLDEGLPFILDTFRRYDIKATFFVNGGAVDHLTDGGLLKEMTKGSHEIASHGYRHTDYRGWDYEKIKEEICISKKILEQKTGARVTGYRAPQFLLDPKIVEAVKECGFKHDSSLPDISGISAAKMRKVKVDQCLLDAIRLSGIREFPIDSIPVVKVPHGILWINFISFPLYRAIFHYTTKNFMIFYLHAFDLVKNKSRVKMNFKRKVFYQKNGNGIYDLFQKLIAFWISRGVKFVKLEDEI
ncbi:MAG: polysaccharide deacetylase family protein [Thermodesulfovibrionales bacterium]|jgi:peptidoglycan/xylan/chitin deacetylase (PgdA/CDA1 family)